jgi:hypothetical protein
LSGLCGIWGVEPFPNETRMQNGNGGSKLDSWNSLNFEEMDAEKSDLTFRNFKRDETMTTKFFLSNHDSIKYLKITNAIIPDLKIFAKSNMTSLLLLDLTKNAYNRQQIQLLSDKSIFPKLKCFIIEQLSFIEKGLNGRKCDSDKARNIVLIGLNGCDCGIDKIVNGTENNLKIKTSDNKPHSSIISIFVVVSTLVIVVSFLVIKLCLNLTLDPSSQPLDLRF